MIALAFPHIWIPRCTCRRWRMPTWAEIAQFTEGRIQRRPGSGQLKRNLSTGKLKRNSSTSSICCCPVCGDCTQKPSSLSITASGMVIEDSDCCLLAGEVNEAKRFNTPNETLLATDVTGALPSACHYRATSSTILRTYEAGTLCSGAFTTTTYTWEITLAVFSSQATWTVTGPGFNGDNVSANCMTGVTVVNDLGDSGGCGELYGGQLAITPIA